MVNPASEYLHFGIFNRQQKNPNPLLDNKFTFAITKLPQTSWACKSAGIPGTSMDVSYQLTRFNKIPRSALNIDYEPLRISFIVDEDLNNYCELINWMRMAMPVNASSYKKVKLQGLLPGPDGGLVSDAQLIVLNNKSVPNFVCYYRDAFPVSLSGIEFTNDTDNPTEQVATISFAYTWYDLETIDAKNVIYNYYIDPISGNDSNSGTTKTTAWLTVERSNNIILNSGETIAYLNDGEWTLYRSGGMKESQSNLSSNIIDTSSSSF